MRQCIKMLIFPYPYTKHYTVLLLTPKGHESYTSNKGSSLEDSPFRAMLFTIYLTLQHVSFVSPAIFVSFDLDKLYIFYH